MKTITSVLMILLAAQFAIAQTTVQRPANPPARTRAAGPSNQKHYKNLRLQADQLNAAVIAGNFAKAVDLTYFKLIELLGGRASYVVMLDKSMKELQSDDFRVLSTTAEEPLEVFEVANQIYAILPTRMEIKVREGMLVGRTFMIGVSNDGGENWTFVAVSTKLDPGPLRTLFPRAADRIHIPEIKPPVLQTKSKPAQRSS